MSTYGNLSIQTREALKKYIKMKLGWPIITLELTEEQLDFVIDDAVEVYGKWANYDESYYAIDLKSIIEKYNTNPQDTSIPYVKYGPLGEFGVRLPDEIIGIFRYYEDTTNWGPGFWGYINGMAINGTMNPMGSLGTTGLLSGFFLDWHIFQQTFKVAQQLRGYVRTYNYNERSHVLTMDPDPKLNSETKQYSENNRMLIIGCYTVRPEIDVVGEDLVKRLALANAKILIGQIRSKFTGLNFPGGAQLGTDILQEGKDEYDKVMEEIKLSNPTIHFEMNQ
jgi:hypothetical protein